jgi:hypothetical protein
MTSNVNIQGPPSIVEDAVTGSSARRIFVRGYDNDADDGDPVLTHGAKLAESG